MSNPPTLLVAHRLRRSLAIVSASIALGAASGFTQDTASSASTQMRWVATWATAPMDAATESSTAYSVYNPQPNLSFPFPNLDVDGAVNQTMRMIVKPDLWGNTMRFRFSNVFGTQAVTIGPVTVGLQEFGGVVRDGTNTPVTFRGGSATVTIPAGQEVWSDATTLAFVSGPDDRSVAGRNLAVSFLIPGTSGPMTEHLYALATSYLSAPNSGDHTGELLDFSYPYTTVFWYFLDGVDVMAATDTEVVCALGPVHAIGGHQR